jgi:hypothetical protein
MTSSNHTLEQYSCFGPQTIPFVNRPSVIPPDIHFTLMPAVNYSAPCKPNPTHLLPVHHSLSHFQCFDTPR